MDKKTKIVATIGPVSESKEIIKKLIDAGMNVARLNFSHGDHKTHLEKINTLKTLIKEGANIAIMLDTKGPEVRTGDFENNEAEFFKNDITRITMEDILGNKERFCVSYKGLFSDVKVGDVIRLDDGRLSLKVMEKDFSKSELVLQALNSHVIHSKRNVVAPFSRLSMPYISPKDESDLIFACDNDLDFIASSFTRTADDVNQIRSILNKKNNHHIQIIAKIENQEGFNNLDKILEVADGVMVARGDLGVEVPPEDVPIIQKEIIKRARRKNKVVIVATHMLDSMQYNPTPTRAEVSDVANAVFEGCDSVMLSGESASGNFPVESVAMEGRISKRMEEVLDYHRLAEDGFKNSQADHNDSIAFSVANTVILSQAKLIVCFSRSGATARRISYYRPQCPIISISNKEEVKRGLCLTWGVYGYYLEDYQKSMSDYEEMASKVSLQYGLNIGDVIVITGGDGVGNTNFMKICKVK